MGKCAIYIINTTRDVINEIIEKIGPDAILDVHKDYGTESYVVKLDPLVVTVECNSD